MLPSEPVWQESAGSLLLLAAVTETNLLSTLTEAIPAKDSTYPSPRRRSTLTSHQMLLLTLLFLGVVGLHRIWDLRSYTGEGLALLTGRKRAYGYRYTEDFLTYLACIDRGETLTDALARLTKQLWYPSEEIADLPEASFYVDGHRKPVYTDKLIPRGLICVYCSPALCASWGVIAFARCTHS